MFCDGQCKTKKKRCGLLQEMAHFGPDGKKIVGSDYDRCVFGALLDATGTARQDNIRLQAAIEHSRNQQAIDGNRIVETIAQGMAGIIYTASQNPKAASMLNRIAMTIADTQKNQKEALENQTKIANGQIPEENKEGVLLQ